MGGQTRGSAGRRLVTRRAVKAGDIILAIRPEMLYSLIDYTESWHGSILAASCCVEARTVYEHAAKQKLRQAAYKSCRCCPCFQRCTDRPEDTTRGIGSGCARAVLNNERTRGDPGRSSWLDSQAIIPPIEGESFLSEARSEAPRGPTCASRSSRLLSNGRPPRRRPAASSATPAALASLPRIVRCSSEPHR